MPAAFDQRFVEMATLGIALRLLPGPFWQVLDAAATSLRRVSAGSAFASGDAGTVLILGPHHRAGAILDEKPGINLAHPRTLVPCLRDTLPPGRHVLLCAVWSSSGTGMPPDAEAPQWLAGGILRFLGEEIPLPL